MLTENRVSQVGKALGHPARVRILGMLTKQELCVCQLAPILSLDPSVVSRHLQLLARAGLITSRRDGVRIVWKIADNSVLQLLDLIREKIAAQGVLG
jgi:ArsR family transcriptional regulator